MAQDVGIKISKPFYDATTAADADLIFSSSWPSLPIVDEFQRSISSLPYTETIPHGLGYTPFVLSWKKTSGLWTRGFVGYNDGITADSTNIYVNITGNYPFVSGAGVTTVPTDLHLKVYALDISTEVEYDLSARSSVVSAYNADYGIRISKEGANINSTDLRDFILHSRAQSPLILTVKTEASATAIMGGSQIDYTDPQGYVSWVFGFLRSSVNDRYRAVPYYAQAYPRLSINTTTKVYSMQILTAASVDGGSIVVLRDPMFAATDITASY